ncbi:cytochrome C [Algoriphagus boritolerans]|uniref:c-type cytochrome n=1 Tax=Algoriphagus boritolerans TaxID=308111 RepID=UPI000AF7A252
MKINKLFNVGLIALAGLTFACGGGEKAAETTAEPVAAAPAKEMSLEEKYQNDPIYIKGLEKLKTSDCTSCHMVERKIVGPSYAEVAAKYENTEENVTLLATKVIQGGVVFGVKCQCRLIRASAKKTLRTWFVTYFCLKK